MLDWRFRETGPEELLPGYDDLLRFAEQSRLLTPRQIRRLHGAASDRGIQTLRRCHDLREAAAEIFYALVDGLRPPKDAIKKLDRYLHVAQTHRSLEWTGEGMELIYDADGETDLPVWLLAQSAADLLTSDAARSIRACADPECRWLFLDTSKNHSRRWCDMKICGNRMKARRFQARSKG